MNKILIINSKDRTNYETTNTGSFRVYFNQPLFDHNKNVKCKLAGVNIPKTFFNITSSNNRFGVYIFEINETVYATVEQGIYTRSSLLTAIQTALNALYSGTYIFTLSYSNNIVTVSLDSHTFSMVDNELSKLLGFYNCSLQDLAESQTSNGAIQFNSLGNMFIYLDIPQLEKTVYDSKNNCLSTFLIPLNQTPASIDQETNIFIDEITLRSVNVDAELKDPRLNFIDIRLLDSNLNVMNFKNCDWYLILKFY